MAKRVPLGIPDHDGGPLPGLAAALRAVDRAYRTQHCWRFVRAVAAYNFCDRQRWFVEMTVGVQEVAYLGGISERELFRLLQPDGHRHTTLGGRLDTIDRLYGHKPHRRFLRAACCYNFDDVEGWHDETARGLLEVAQEMAQPHWEITEMVIPPSDRFRRRPHRLN